MRKLQRSGGMITDAVNVQTRKKIAVITGASSGLGREFVRQLERIAKGKEPLFEERPEELWVIARREDRLRALAEWTDIPLRILPYDLTDRKSIELLQDQLGQEPISVRILINAAGYGRIGTTENMKLEDLDGMIDLNCRAAVDVTQICLPYMEEGAKILEICSIAAFMPLSQLNIYAASKAFLYHYSRALRVELRPRKISVTAVCPYWVKDTEFIGIANADGAYENHGIHSYPLAGTREKVVRQALKDAARNLPVSTPGVVSSIVRAARKMLPYDQLLAVWECIRKM